MKRRRCNKPVSVRSSLNFPSPRLRPNWSIRSDLSADPGVDGILLQHPVPSQIDERAAFEAIEPAKDVDGVTMTLREDGLRRAGIRLGHARRDHASSRRLRRPALRPHAVVVGRSPILGKPLGMLLLARNATVTYCHSNTADCPQVARRPRRRRCRPARAGQGRLDQARRGGRRRRLQPRQRRRRRVRDARAERASMITPVPGGVGPMTIAVLLHRTTAAPCSPPSPPANQTEIPVPYAAIDAVSIHASNFCPVLKSSPRWDVMYGCRLRQLRRVLTQTTARLDVRGGQAGWTVGGCGSEQDRSRTGQDRSRRPRPTPRPRSPVRRNGADHDAAHDRPHPSGTMTGPGSPVSNAGSHIALGWAHHRRGGLPERRRIPIAHDERRDNVPLGLSSIPRHQARPLVMTRSGRRASPIRLRPAGRRPG